MFYLFIYTCGFKLGYIMPTPGQEDTRLGAVDKSSFSASFRMLQLSLLHTLSVSCSLGF